MKKDKALQSAYQHYQAGDLNQAGNTFKKILKVEPDNIDALRMLGGICYQLGDFDNAIIYIKKEIEIAPSNAIAYNNLGLVLQAKGVLTEAINCFRKAVTLSPRVPDVYYNLGLACQNAGQIDEAIMNYQKAIQIEPGLIEAYNNLGVLLRAKGRLDEAIAWCRKALRMNPSNANIYNNLGLSLKDKGNIDEAIANYQKAINLNPDFAGAYYNLGIVLRNKGQFEESINYFQKAIQIEPAHADFHYNLSYPLLLLGNFEEGWKEYEWRWKTEELVSNPSNPCNFSLPLWDGSDIMGKTILLHTEQGYGDAIQFIRYAPLLARQGVKVLILCPKELISLFQNVEGIHQVIGGGEYLPSFDIHCPLLSLPLKFNTTLDTIPAEIPYIKADTALLQKWKDKVKDDNLKLRVGLSWAGRPEHENDSNRALALETFATLAQSDGIIFYSLQKGKGSEQAQNPPEGMNLIDYTDELNDFSDTAALIENLDLIISVDTAVAHLAGALGKPVWTLLPFAPDWRWMLNREDSPWYPTMRLFRQPSPGDWQSVIEKVEEELRLFIKGMPASSTRDNITHLCAHHDNFVNQANNAKEEKMEKMPDEDDFYQTGEDMLKQKETAAIILNCEGMGDCLFAIAVIRKFHITHGLNHKFIIFTHRPELFKKCPYIEEAYSIHDANKIMQYQKRIALFDTSQMPHWLVDTYDFISIPAGIGELSFREKQLEYFPVEEDRSEHYDVVINTSETWPSRSWPIENWQKVADHILAQGYSIAVVGKDTFSKADNMWKRSQGLKGCVNLTNKLSLDQTYFTIKNCDLFITCQNGLSVLSGATDTEIIVLDMSIEWSKRAIYRNEDPHYKVTYVKGNCQLYCCSSFECTMYGEFRCIPTVEQVLDVVKIKIS
jgi:tetratricopeptide (TPR) repeat protein